MKPSVVLSLPARILGIALLTALTAGAAYSQGDQSVSSVTYYANNVTGAPDGTVRVINDGSTGGNLWAAFYVFDDNEELSACCSCEVTPDGVLSESVRNQLTSNPITGKVPVKGVIRIISSSTSSAGSPTPTAGLSAWATHIQSVANRNPNGPAPYFQTEARFADSNLTSGEEWLLAIICYYVPWLGSGQGICSCSPEDVDF